MVLFMAWGTARFLLDDPSGLSVFKALVAWKCRPELSLVVPDKQAQTESADLFTVFETLCNLRYNLHLFT